MKRIAFAYHFNDHDWLGGRNYFASLIGAIRAVRSEQFQFCLVIGEKTVTDLPQSFPWLEVLRTPLMDRMHALWLIRQATLKFFNYDVLLERFLLRHRIDLLSHTGFLAKRSQIHTLPWLYDFQFMHLPEYWTEKQITKLSRRYLGACKYGDGLIVSSESAARDLRKFAPWCTKPVYVQPFVSNPVNIAQLMTAHAIKSKYNLPDRYFHIPNQFWSNKNHGLVLKALGILHHQGIDATVVCTGKTFDARQPRYFDQLIEKAHEMGLANQFRTLGVVPQVDVQSLMAHSHAVINPSKFEGWSTSVEEAKTLHKRLLLSDLQVHREQVPDGLYFFATDDAVTLAKHMASAWQAGIESLDEVAIEADYQSRLRLYGESYLALLNQTLSARSQH